VVKVVNRQKQEALLSQTDRATRYVGRVDSRQKVNQDQRKQVTRLSVRYLPAFINFCSSTLFN